MALNYVDSFHYIVSSHWCKTVAPYKLLHMLHNGKFIVQLLGTD